VSQRQERRLQGTEKGVETDEFSRNRDTSNERKEIRLSKEGISDSYSGTDERR